MFNTGTSALIRGRTAVFHWIALVGITAVGGLTVGCSPGGGGDDTLSMDAVDPEGGSTTDMPTPIDRPFSCPALQILPNNPRVATDRAMTFRAVGGSGGIIPWTIEGMTRGSYIEPAGGFRAGSTAETVTVVATDSLCGLSARTMVEVVGPFEVTPARARVMRGGTVNFTPQNAIGPVRYAIFSRPDGAGAMGTISAMGGFTAGMVDGDYLVVATDEGASKSVRLTVTVGMGTPLRARNAVLAVPSGMRVPLLWDGGSGAQTYAISDMARGRITTDRGVDYFEALGNGRASVTVTATDRSSPDTARVTILIGDQVAPEPQRRGTQTAAGDLAVGDVNGDGFADLIVGHAERSVADIARRRFTGRNTGGILVYNGAMDGSFSATPSTVIDGDLTEDRFGSVLLVRDVNRDMIDDVLVGVPDSDLGEGDRGAFALYLGSRAGLQATTERVLNGEDTQDRFGSAIAVADLNNDHAPELIVGSPNAIAPAERVRPAAQRCQGGRIYIYRGIAEVPGNPPVRGVFESIPFQVIDVRAPLTDAAMGPAQCAAASLGAGRSLAVLDVDGDMQLDIAVGAPSAANSLVDRPPASSPQHGQVYIYKGLGTGRVESTPAYALQLAPSLRHAPYNFGLTPTQGTLTAGFGQNLDVIAPNGMMPGALIIRSFSFAATAGMPMASTPAAGAFWVFTTGAGGSLGAPLPEAMGTRPVKVLTTDAARSFAYGDAASRGLGRHAIVADSDGDGALEYLVSAVSGTPAAMIQGGYGSLYRFAVSDLLTMSGRITLPTRLIEGTMPMANTVPTELTGYRFAAWGAGMARGSGLAVWSPWRDTTITVGGSMVAQPFSGAIDYVVPGAGGANDRWSMAGARRSIVLDQPPGGDRAGTTVALGSFASRTSEEAVVNAPLTHSPALPMAMPPARAGANLNTSAIEVYNEMSAPVGRYFRPYASGAPGVSPMVVLDFDGDGTSELAVAEQFETVTAAGTPAECQIFQTVRGPDGGVNRLPINGSSRGIVHIYSLVAGQWTERWRAVSKSETVVNMGAGPTGFQLNRFGAALAAADVNGDNRDDLIVAHPGTPDGNSVEVVLGRVAPAMGVGTVCNSPTGAPFASAPGAADATTYVGVNVDAVGDLDRDGCDEFVASVLRNPGGGNTSTTQRAGFLLVFGSNPDMMSSCRRTPATMWIVPDERNFANNVVGDVSTRDDDTFELPAVPGTMGRTFALGAGDLDGDMVPDVVYRTVDLGFGPFRGPSVEILSGQMLAQCASMAGCPAAVRPSFIRDGAYMALGVRTLVAPHRLIVPSPSSIAARFGTSLALANLTGDAAAELLIGSPDDSLAEDFAGVVLGYRGGATFTQNALTADPWLVAVGDLRERGDFGASVAAQRNGATSWLLVGAPLSSRDGTGGELGAAFRWSANGL